MTKVDIRPLRLSSHAQNAQFSHGAAHAPVLVDPKTAEPLLYLSHYASYPNSLPISRYALRGALAKRVEQAGKIAYEKQFDRIEVADEKTQRLRVHFKDGTPVHTAYSGVSEDEL